MTSNDFPFDRMHRRLRLRAFVIGLVIGALAMFAVLAYASLNDRVEPVQVSSSMRRGA